jgi:hypothetical protein
MTTPAAVLRVIDAAMLPGDDMFDVKSGCLSGGIREMAVFAPAAGLFADELAKGPRHRESWDRFSRARALA